jgi:hypothetical protein
MMDANQADVIARAVGILRAVAMIADSGSVLCETNAKDCQTMADNLMRVLDANIKEAH